MEPPFLCTYDDGLYSTDVHCISFQFMHEFNSVNTYYYTINGLIQQSALFHLRSI